MSHVAALYVYPVKSCRGIALAEAVLDERGIVHDREFMVVDLENRLRTQRADPRLAQVGTALTDDALFLHFPGAGEVRVPFRDPMRRPREVTVWSDTVVADDTGDEAAAWVSRVLGQPSRLVVMGEHSSRVRHEMHARDRSVLPTPRPVALSFPDGYPLLVVSEESLADLNGCLDLPEPLRMDRFRPNVVVAGCDAPYAEDAWKAFRIGDARLLPAGACRRCMITTTDQQTLARGVEPLRYLAKHRRTSDGQVVFGQNVIHASPGGRLRVGDPVVPED